MTCMHGTYAHNSIYCAGPLLAYREPFASDLHIQLPYSKTNKKQILLPWQSLTDCSEC